MNRVSSMSFGPHGSLCFSLNRSRSFRRFSLHFQLHTTRAVASHIVGYPRIGPKRELKFAFESFWDGKTSAEELQTVAANVRSSIWKQLAEAGIKYIPSNTFSYYDQMLDTTAMIEAVPQGMVGNAMRLDSRHIFPWLGEMPTFLLWK